MASGVWLVKPQRPGGETVSGTVFSSCPQPTFNAANNQIIGYAYDAAGNMTNDSVHAYTWDAEGRLVKVDAGSTATYTYDALGQRVYGVVGANPEIFYMYDPAGNLLYATMTDGWGGDELTEPVAGRVLASYVNGQSDTYFKHANPLGSWGLITAQDGSVPQDQLYYPWGQTWTSGHYLFEPNYAAMAWYNAESDLFLTPARSYGSRLGRWMSPDPLGGDVTNPQSLNRYAYVRNNPTSLTDPTGLDSAFTIDYGCSNTIAQMTSAACQDAGGGPSGGGNALDSGYPPDMPLGALGAYSDYLEDICSGCFPFQGTLYGNYVDKTFDSWGQYADWRTSLAVQPENQVYEAFYALLENIGLDPNTEYAVNAFQNGPTWNVQLLGTALNTAKAAQGGIPDPSHIVHAGNSWYGLSPIDALHLVDDPMGAQAHFDLFNGVLMFPLHELFDYLPSFFINPKSQIPQNTSTWHCSGNGGCW